MNTSELLSERGKDWVDFAHEVMRHVEHYTVPQYGDKGKDLASKYTVNDCMRQIEKYAARAGRSARPGEQQLDLLKIAHYAQMAWSINNDREPV